MDAGTTFDEVITVSNEGSSATGLVVAVRSSADSPPEYASTDWITISPDKFQLGPGETQDVAVHVSVPADAQAGGRYSTIFFSNAPLNVGAGGAEGFFGASGLGAEIGAPFIMTIRGGNLTLRGELSRIVPLALAPSLLGFRMEIDNTGNVHMVASGEVEMKDAGGNIVGAYTLPETTAILPGTSKSFRLRGSHELPPGEYTASANFSYGWTGQQSQAANVDAADWGERAAGNEISFNSVPQLRVSSLEMTSIEGGVRFNLALENFGDVEVAPEGTIDVRSASGQRIIALNVSRGSIVAEPHTIVPSEKIYNGAIPQGDYDVSAVFHYQAADFAEKVVTAAVESDIVPVVIPEAARFRESESAAVTVTKERASLLLIGAWVLLGGGLGLVAALAGLAIGSRVLGLPKQ